MGAINSNSNKLNDVIKMLKKGHDPNYQDAKTGETPMTSAILSKCSTDLLLHLVSEGAHLDYRNSRGDTPLHVAAVSGNVVALKTVLDLGASPNSRSSDNLTPLHQLCRARDVELANYCVQMLLENYSVVDVADQAGNTELHHSCRLGRLHITRKLIVYGANINRQNETGNTPLHVAIFSNQELIARKLLAYGAKKDINNHSNLDAYGSAVTISSDYLAEYIANFKPSDISRIEEKPVYTPTRKANQARRPSMQTFLQQQQQLERDRKMLAERLSQVISESTGDEDELGEEERFKRDNDVVEECGKTDDNVYENFNEVAENMAKKRNESGCTNHNNNNNKNKLFVWSQSLIASRSYQDIRKLTLQNEDSFSDSDYEPNSLPISATHKQQQHHQASKINQSDSPQSLPPIPTPQDSSVNSRRKFANRTESVGTDQSVESDLQFLMIKQASAKSISARNSPVLNKKFKENKNDEKTASIRSYPKRLTDNFPSNNSDFKTYSQTVSDSNRSKRPALSLGLFLPPKKSETKVTSLEAEQSPVRNYRPLPPLPCDRKIGNANDDVIAEDLKTTTKANEKREKDSWVESSSYVFLEGVDGKLTNNNSVQLGGNVVGGGVYEVLPVPIIKLDDEVLYSVENKNSNNNNNNNNNDNSVSVDDGSASNDHVYANLDDFNGVSTQQQQQLQQQQQQQQRQPKPLAIQPPKPASRPLSTFFDSSTLRTINSSDTSARNNLALKKFNDQYGPMRERCSSLGKVNNLETTRQSSQAEQQQLKQQQKPQNLIKIQTNQQNVSYIHQQQQQQQQPIRQQFSSQLSLPSSMGKSLSCLDISQGKSPPPQPPPRSNQTRTTTTTTNYDQQQQQQEFFPPPPTWALTMTSPATAPISGSCNDTTDSNILRNKNLSPEVRGVEKSRDVSQRCSVGVEFSPVLLNERMKHLRVSGRLDELLQKDLNNDNDVTINTDNNRNVRSLNEHHSEPEINSINSNNNIEFIPGRTVPIPKDDQVIVSVPVKPTDVIVDEKTGDVFVKIDRSAARDWFV